MSPKFETREEYEAWKANRIAETQVHASDAEKKKQKENAEARLAASREQEIEAVHAEMRAEAERAAERLAAAKAARAEMRADAVPGVGMLSGIATLNLIAGVLVGFAFLVAAADAERGEPGVVYATIGIAVFLEGLLFYGFVRVFTTIAEESRRIRRALEARPVANDR